MLRVRKLQRAKRNEAEEAIKKLDIGPTLFFASLFEDLATLCANNQYQEYLVTHYLHESPLVPPFSSKLRPTKLI
jgi:hypothetical protein